MKFTEWGDKGNKVNYIQIEMKLWDTHSRNQLSPPILAPLVYTAKTVSQSPAHTHVS